MKIIRVVNVTKIVRVLSDMTALTRISVKNFVFIATEGQTTFNLDYSYKIDGLVALYINGTGQSKAAGDFTISGKVLTIPGGVRAGSVVAGFYDGY
jgi:hypothetical protein